MGNESIKVLLVEDNPEDIQLISAGLTDVQATGPLAPSFDLECVNHLSAGLECMAAGGIDVVLLDLSLPDGRGFDIFARLRAQAPQVPIIVLTTLDDQEVALRAVRQGAQDYLVKGRMDSNLLVRAIGYAIERQRMRAALAQQAQALQASETRLQTIITSSADAIIVVDGNGLIRFVNPAAEALLDREVKELLGEMFNFPIVVGETTELNITHRGDTITIAEMRVVETKWEGETAYLASLRDITERKQAEEALAHERNILRILIDNLPDYLYVKDTESRFVISNIATAHFMGATSPDELIGKTDFDFYPRELAAQYYADERAVIQSGQPLIDREEPAINPAGNLKWHSATKIPLRDSQDNIMGLVGITRDITGHKRVDEMLRRAHDEVEMRVLARTAELVKANQILEVEIIERKRAQEAMRESEERFRNAFGYAPIGMALETFDGHFLQVNKSWCDMVGYSQEEALTLRFADITHPDDLDISYAFLDQLLAGEINSYQIEKRYLHKLGHVVWSQVSVSLLRDSNENPLYLIAQTQDITERKRAEEALRESEQRYKQLLGSVTDYIYTARIEHSQVVSTTHSPNCVAVTGYTAQEYEVDPHLWYRMVYEADRPAVMKQAERLLAGEVVLPLEHRIIHKNGSIRWVRHTPVLRKDEQGNVIAYDGLIADITERKQAEEALRRSESKYRLLMEHASDGIVIFDPYGKILGVNSKAFEMLGYTSEDFPHLNISELIPEEDLVTTPLGFDELRAGKTLIRERRLRRKDGRLVPVEISAKMIEEGRIQAIIRDITERKEVEQREKLAYELGRQLTTVLDPDVLLTETVNRLKETFGYYHVQVYLFNELPLGSHRLEKETMLVVQAGTGQAGLELKRRKHAISLKARQSLVARAARLLEPVVVNDISQDPEHLPNPLLPDTRSEVAIPLFLGQRPIGVLDVQDSTSGHFDEDEVRTLQIVANQLAVALANAQLFAENARRLAIIEHSFDLVALSSMEDGLVIYMNPAGVYLLGYDKLESVIGRPMTDFYTPEGRKLVEEKGLPVALEQNMWRGENYLRRADGKLVPTDQTIFVTHKERGQPQMLATIMTDITERKRAEEERERLFEEVKAGRERLQALSHRLVEVQEAERRHIARELHDEVGQLLTGVKLTLEMSVRLPDDQIRASLGETQALINELIAQVRELSLELRPAMLDDLGLLPTLMWHFERYTAQTQIQVNFKHTELNGRLTPEVETTAYRIVQEALTNVARYARVNEVIVRLWVDQDMLNVQIEDEGIGFDPEAEQTTSSSSGLSGMYERAALLNGQLTIESSPGSGTCLTAKLPLRPLTKVDK